MTYRLRLPVASKVHPVFHVQLLKRAVVTQSINAALPEESTLEKAAILLPHKVLAHRSLREQGELIKHYLIQWQTKPIEEANWEEALAFKSKFPAFSLEDKTALDEGRGVVIKKSPSMINIFGVCILKEEKGHVQEEERG